MALLNVPYFYQHDNLSGQGYRECFSSSCAMIAAFYGKVQSDDEYNSIRRRFGDTTNPKAHLITLEELGLKPTYSIFGDVELLRKLVTKQKIPVAVGWLQNGYIATPDFNSGHWSVIIGIDNWKSCHHDPNGEADLIYGGYENYNKGKAIQYSHRNWLPRWMPEGAGNGHYLYCQQ